jgi:SAM-dependent methyltransferase
MSQRNNCVLCESLLYDTDIIFTLDKMPVFMGVVDNPINYIYDTFIIAECKTCGLLQNKNLLDLKLVYLNNHNTQVVGNTWKTHFEQLSQFITDNTSKNKILLEIGDPAGKLSNKISNHFNKWITVEPNPDTTKTDHINNLIIIKDYFTDSFTPPYDIDAIVHSHLFEHVYNPLEFLTNCFNTLKDGGQMFFSIPNLLSNLENKFLPMATLQFEHTYFIDSINVYYFLRKTGFEIKELKYFKDHSIFVHAVKSILIIETIPYRNIASKYIENVLNHDKNILNIANLLSQYKTTTIFIYGAHYNTQYVVTKGIDENNFIGCLDGSTSKQGKYLYGTKLFVYSPNKITEFENVVVYASHMGIYFNEIKDSLLQLSKNILIC